MVFGAFVDTFFGKLKVGRVSRAMDQSGPSRVKSPIPFHPNHP